MNDYQSFAREARMGKIVQQAALGDPGTLPFSVRHISVALCMLSFGCLSSLEEPDMRSKRQDVEEPVSASNDSAEGTAFSLIRSSVRRKGDTVEIEIQADRPFEFGAMPPVLVIGKSAFGRSHFPADGNLNALIFVVEAAEYDALSAEARVSFGYLDATAELESPPKGARGAARTPKIRPDQVREPRQLENLTRGRMEISQ